jgi:tetratricopeptide (TPR) repeat protein
MEKEANAQKIREYISTNPLISTVITAVITAVITLMIPGIVTKLGAYISDPGTKLTKAERLLDKGDKKRAVTLLKQIIVDEHENKTVLPKALITRADIYISDEDFESAIQYADDAIKRNEYNGDAYYILGRAYSLKGEHEKAIQNFVIALK